MSAKLSSKKKKKENTGKEIMASLIEYSLALLGIVLCVLVPLYMQNGYYKIGTAKFNAYKYIIMIGTPLIMVFILMYFIFTWKEVKANIKDYFKFQISTTDYFVLGFLVLALISYFASGYLKDAFMGYDGWFMGLFAQLSFILIYFMFSRFGKDYKLILFMLCATAFITFTIGILHRLLIDPIGVYSNIDDYYKTQFLSTLGQASWYSSFVCTVLPLGVFFFWESKSWIIRTLSGIFTFAGFATLVSQNSDSAYIAFTAMIMILLFVSVKDAKKMQRLCEIMLLFTIAPKFMFIMLKIHPNHTLDLDTISSTLIFNNIIWVLPVLFALAWFLFQYFDIKECYPKRAMLVARNIIYGLVVAMILLATVILILSANGKINGSLLALTEKIPYLTWSNVWGNGRGFTWSFTGRMFAEMNIFHKLFGVGPDSYASYAYIDYTDVLKEMWGSSVLTNAHNEWLNMMINYGIFGAVAYIGIFVSAIVRFIKNCDKSPVLLGFATCIGAYMGHNLFCYQQVLCTPFIFLFIAIGEYLLRNIKKEQTLN